MPGEDQGQAQARESAPEWAKSDVGPLVPLPSASPIDSAFQVHRLNELGMKKAAEIAYSFNRLLQELKFMCPGGREFAIVKTKLEEACFFAKKSMANEKENQA